MEAERQRQEQLVNEARIKAEQMAAEKAQADAQWFAEQELRKQQQTVQAQDKLSNIWVHLSA